MTIYYVTVRTSNPEFFIMLKFSLKSTIPGPKTLSMLILDASGSMQTYRHAPQECVNKLLEDLRGDATATHITGLITFNDVYTVAIPPAPVATIRPYTAYHAEGNTLLYRTVKRTVEGLYDAWRSSPRKNRRSSR